MSLRPDPRRLVLFLEAPFAEFQDTEVEAREVMLVAFDVLATEYWMELAIGWLEQGAPIDITIAERLEDVSRNKQLDQQTRHRAFALAVRWWRLAGDSPR